jgi:tRNA threonylcarbamoyladenosine biosynthesis protein TsaE
METKTLATLDELRVLARDIMQMVVLKERAQVIALTGDLGAGKTAFVKELGKYFGVAEQITSPTFVIMKSYPVVGYPPLKTLTHIDAYRIEDVDEMRVLGFDEILKDPERLVCIEWPEKIQELIPEGAITVSLILNAGGSRTVTYGK